MIFVAHGIILTLDHKLIYSIAYKLIEILLNELKGDKSNIASGDGD